MVHRRVFGFARAGLLLVCVVPGALLSSAQAQLQPEPSGLEAAVAVERVLVEAIATAERSVVAIARIQQDRQSDSELGLGLRRDPLFEQLRPRPNQPKPTDPDFIPNHYGTGVVIDRGGLILTQYHVVRSGDIHLVTTSDRRTFEARILAADPHSGLAVLAVDASDLVPIQIADTAKLRKGRIVIALGNPYAIARDGKPSASWGIVSNIARKAGPEPVDGASRGRNSLHHFGTLIQTDAKLNLGTSGGALVDLRGEMIGLTTSVAATAGYETAAGYAIPMNATFLRIIETLKKGREVEYGFLGVATANLAVNDLRRGIRGVRVTEVVPGTPAAKAKLRADDLITQVNDEPIYDTDDLMLHVGKLPVEARARLTVFRNGQPLKTEAQLAKKLVYGEKIAANGPSAWRGLRVDYATAVESYRELSRRGSVDFSGCVAVSEVDRDSPAWKEGLRPNQFISHVAGVRVQRPRDFYDLVGRRNGPVAVRLVLPAHLKPNRTIPVDE